MTVPEVKAFIVTRKESGLDSPNLTRLCDEIVAKHAKESKLKRILDDPNAVDRLMEDDRAMERLLGDLEL